MELISSPGCAAWRGMLAVRSLGGLTEYEAVGLRAHLEGCLECSALALDVEAIVPLLEYADPTAVAGADAPPPGLTDRVLTDLRGAGAHRRRQRRLRAGALGASALAATALVLALVVAGGGRGPTPAQWSVVFPGSAPGSASAVLSAHSWGTSVAFHELGLAGGHAYTVSMQSRDGSWWTAGSFRSVSGRAVDFTLTCSVALRDITGIRVTSASGVVVLSSYRAWS
jgi:hypothetical protein